MKLIFDINISVTITVTLIIGLVIGGSVVAHYLKHPDKLEKLCSLFYKSITRLFKSAENNYIKYDIQFHVNSFINDLYQRIPSLTPTSVKLEWIDENQTAEQFIKSDQLVLRMHRSTNQNKNVVNATFTFVTYSLLRKAKRYIAKYQKESIDLFVSFKLLEKAKYQILDEFVQEYLQAGLEKEKVVDLYEKFFDMDKAGLFFPVFLSEMTFLGEKVFGKKRDDERIFEEVKNTVYFLNRFSLRKFDEQAINEFNGTYCKYVIRIIGKRFKIDKEGEKVYLNNLKKIPANIETIYLIGSKSNKSFINSIVSKFIRNDGYLLHHKYEYKAKIKDKEEADFEVETYLIVLRNNTLEVFHRD
jgi:phosphopantetheine adenylyltransferase